MGDKDISDEEWCARLGITCRYPDGADRCEGCPHYRDPKTHLICVWDDSVFGTLRNSNPNMLTEEFERFEKQRSTP